MNLIGTSKELIETAEILKKEFEMKDLGKTRYCLGPQIEHRKDGIIVHQSNYTQKVLRRFSHHDVKSSPIPMIVRTLDIYKDPFLPKEVDEEILSLKCSYLGAICALLYLAQCTRPDISFAVNYLARHSIAPTRRHWNGIKDIFRYLKGTTDMGLFYPYASSSGSTPLALEIMQPLSAIPILITYQNRIRDVLNLVMYLPLGIRRYLGGLENRP
ncbi:hypothetical protein M0R45_031162 [Rubus argutus]|uniref:Reverse transcriptase Ty1/copia-type domain-containing protein n=1 Tax=Rubus argutus TaxID=59490 RepID=A0AAW1WHA6_RUBAR